MKGMTVAALVLVGAGACAAGTEPPIDGPYVGLTVTGTVRASDGAPVPGASLHVVARAPDTCTGVLADGNAATDSVGAFTRTVANWNVPRDVCVWIGVVPPDGSGLAADTITITPARLDVATPLVAVDITLPQG